MAQINPTQDYDAIHTLTFASASGTCKIRLFRGSSSAYTGTVYYRAGTSGAWTSLSVSGTSTTFNVTSTTMQVAHDWNKDGNNYMTPSFYGQSANLVGISISQKAVLSGTVGDYFMSSYAFGCSKLTSLSVPDTSGLTSVGTLFMYAYAYDCSSLTSLSAPDTSGLTSVGVSFMRSYASSCSSLTSLSVPDTSGLTSVGYYFMYSYASSCSKLTSLSVPDTSGLTSVGDDFMNYYAQGCSSLTSLILPAVGSFATHNIDWSVPSGRLGYLKGHANNVTDRDNWRALTTSSSPNTLYINYIRSTDDVILPPKPPTVTTQDCSSVYSVKATANGNITNVYGANATRRGFCYMTGTTGDPTTSNSVAYDDGNFGTGTFNKVITGLSPSTNYRVRPYATNSAGTGYGTTVQLTTLTDEHTLEVSDTMAVGDSYSLRKALKMAGVLQIGTYSGWYVGANYWAGGFTRNFIEEFVDSLKVRDNMSKIAGYVRGLVESLNLSEAFTSKFERAVFFLDSIVVRSGLERLYEMVRGWVESVSLTDTFDRVVGNIREFVESISLTESFNASMLYIKGLVDSIVASDLYANSVGKVLRSVVTVTDAFTSTMTLIREYFVDAINVVDNWWKAFVISLVDTISLEDVLSGFTKTYKRVMQEIMSISDLVSKNATIVLASIVKVLDGEFVRKLNGRLIAWGKGIRKVLEWAKVVKKEDEYLTIERKLNDWEVREKDLGLYESKVKPLDEWTKLRKEK